MQDPLQKGKGQQRETTGQEGGGSLGKFKLSQIANMDQTPLQFCFSNGPTYAGRGDKSVWVKSGASGRQCTVQIAIFADGEPRVKPLLIFRGKGLRISMREKVNILLHTHVF